MSKFDLINEWFYYDETSSTSLRWKKDKWVGKTYNVHRIKKDSEAGSLGQRRVTVFINGTFFAAHAVIWALCKNVLPDPNINVIDHIDGNPFNNKINNLRLVTQKINTRNMKLNSANKSGTMGVSLHLNKYWKATWNENKKHMVIYFSIKKLGDVIAKEKATECRENAIKRLNKLGYQYTDRHGK